MNGRNVPMAACGVVVLLLAAGRPASAVMLRGDTASAHPGGRAAATGATSVNRDGVVQALDVGAQTIVINGARYLIGSPQLALVDKRPKSDGRLTLAGVKAGMYVRYRVEKTAAGDRVVELWVMRDPQQAPGKRP